MKHAGFDAQAFSSAEEILAAIAQQQPDMVISDVIMKGMNGIDLAIWIAQHHPSIKVLLLSGQTETSGLIEAARIEGWDFELHAKPMHPRILLDRVGTLLMS